MADLIWYQLWRELPAGLQYLNIVGMYWSAVIVLDAAITLALGRWRRLNGWMMLAENAVFVACFELLDNFVDAQEQSLLWVFVPILLIKFAISLAADALQNRRTAWSKKSIALAATVASLRGNGTCIALNFLAVHYTYALRSMSVPFLFWTIVDMVFWQILRKHLSRAPFIVPLENALFVLAVLPSPGNSALVNPVVGYLLIKCAGSLLAIAIGRLRCHTSSALNVRQIFFQAIWVIARMLPVPLLLLLT